MSHKNIIFDINRTLKLVKICNNIIFVMNIDQSSFNKFFFILFNQLSKLKYKYIYHYKNMFII